MDVLQAPGYLAAAAAETAIAVYDEVNAAAAYALWAADEITAMLLRIAADLASAEAIALAAIAKGAAIAARIAAGVAAAAERTARTLAAYAARAALIAARYQAIAAALTVAYAVQVVRALIAAAAARRAADARRAAAQRASVTRELLSCMTGNMVACQQTETESKKVSVDEGNLSGTLTLTLTAPGGSYFTITPSKGTGSFSISSPNYDGYTEGLTLNYNGLAKDGEKAISADASLDTPVSVGKNGCLWCNANTTLKSGNPSITMSADFDSVTVEEQGSYSYTLDGVPLTVSADATLTGTWRNDDMVGELSWEEAAEAGGAGVSGRAVVYGLEWLAQKLAQACEDLCGDTG